MIFNKSLHPDDYDDINIESFTHIYNYTRERVPASIQHPHRKWEYCLAFAAFRNVMMPKSLLEVGSGGSLFAPMADYLSYNVTVVDPEDSVRLTEKQGANIEIFQEDFFDFQMRIYDAVACLSVIEHVENDIEFFQKLLKHTRKVLFLTTDFSMEGKQFVPYHLRTYSPSDLQNLADIANLMGFVLLDEPEWIDNGPRVFDYNFASLCLVRE